MPAPSEQPAFCNAQLEFAAHIRHPQLNTMPAGVDPRRMKIYTDLFYRTIEGFLASTFAITKSLLDKQHWCDMVRDFIHRHVSKSPYFLEIPQEFLAYLKAERVAPDDPPFLLEMCHYEWVELAVDVADENRSESIDEVPDLWDGVLVLTPYLRLLSYRYPVHHIGPGYQPDEAPAAATLLAVYRNNFDKVKFSELSPTSFRLLQLLSDQNTDRVTLTGRRVLEILYQESPALDFSIFLKRGRTALEQYHARGIILGSHGQDLS